jgi:hypothetical protein
LDVPVYVDVSLKSTMTAESFGNKDVSATIVLFSLKKQLYDQFGSFTGDLDISSFTIENILLSALQLDNTLPLTIRSLKFGYREQMNLPTQWLAQAENISLSAFQSGNYPVSKQGAYRLSCDIQTTVYITIFPGRMIVTKTG